MTNSTTEINSGQETKEQQSSSSPDTTTATTSPQFVDSAQSAPAPRVRRTFGHLVEAERVLW